MRTKAFARGSLTERLDRQAPRPGLRTALDQSVPERREALLLVAAGGLPYGEAAAICGVAVGTINSPVNQARTRLAELLAFAA
jgi:DNA-directed RNA polymerase specialized sigma24 family protein